MWSLPQIWLQMSFLAMACFSVRTVSCVRHRSESVVHLQEQLRVTADHFGKVSEITSAYHQQQNGSEPENVSGAVDNLLPRVQNGSQPQEGNQSIENLVLSNAQKDDLSHLAAAMVEHHQVVRPHEDSNRARTSSLAAPVSREALSFKLCALGGCLLAILLCCFWPRSWRRLFQAKSQQSTAEPAQDIHDPYPRPADEDSTSSDTDDTSPKGQPRSHLEESATDGMPTLLKECEPEKIADLIDESKDLGIDFIQPEWTSASVAAALAAHGIETSAWPKKALEELARELSKGKARFCKRKQELFRVLDIAIVLLVYEPKHLVIQELSHPAYRRNFGEILEKTVKGRVLAGENLKDCAQRCLDEKLGFLTEKIVRVSSDILQIRESHDQFEDSLPGLSSLTRFYVVEANVVATDPDDLEKLGLLSRSLHVSDYTYRWENIAEIRHVRKHLRQKFAKPAQQKGSKRGIIDHSLVPVMPWNAKEVEAMLHRYGVKDCSQFCGMDLMELHRALSDGNLSLGVLPGTSHERSDGQQDGQQDGRLVCVAETISMIVKLADKQVIVCSPPGEGLPRSFLPDSRDQRSHGSAASDKHHPPSASPTTWKLSNESTCMTALRLSQKQFKLCTPIFKLDGRLLSVIDTIGTKESCIHRESIVLGPWLPGR